MFSVDYVVIYYFILFVIYLCIYVQPLIKVYVAHQMVVVLLFVIQMFQLLDYLSNSLRDDDKQLIF